AIGSYHKPILGRTRRIGDPEWRGRPRLAGSGLAIAYLVMAGHGTVRLGSSAVRASSRLRVLGTWGVTPRSSTLPVRRRGSGVAGLALRVWRPVWRRRARERERGIRAGFWSRPTS